LTVVSFNVESGSDTDPAEVAKLIRRLDGVDLWGLSEVQNDAAATVFLNAAKSGEGGTFRYFLSRSGGADRLQIIYRSDKLELLETRELLYLRLGSQNVRGALVGKLKLLANGEELYFMVNHLWRGNEDGRHQQAELLNQWGRAADAPVIAVGDYNFDWEVVGGDTDHDEGYDRMIAGDVFEWVRPTELIKTQCSPSFDSVLDFVFAAGAAKAWSGTAEILEHDPSYCDSDSEGGSDHRPVMATFDVP
jgi:endonuclease/exonuclease/phosphatase family metal-dependent hydrolase